MNYAAYKNSSGTEKSDWIAGWVAIAVYLLLLILLVLFVTFGVKKDEFDKKEVSSGVLINFGDNSPGHGDVITKNVVAAKSEPQKKAEVKEPIEDDNAVDAEVKAVPKRPKEVVKKKPTPKPEPKQPEVNKGALYKRNTGATNSNKNSSHGSTSGRDGKSGSPDGELGNAGGGGIGGNFSLTGRSLIGALAKPDYDERIDGQIVIEIQVNREGRVTAATFLPKSSTISSRTIIEAVRQAAMKTKFNTDQKAAFTQVGTITYILKVE